MATPAPTSPRPDGLTVFYNGACPVCRREIDHYRRYTDAHALPLRWTDAAADPTTLARRGVDAETQRRRLHALTPDGRIAVGIEALELMWARMPHYRWLAALLRIRPVRAAAHVGYDRVLAALLYRWDRRRRRSAGSGDLPHDDQT